MIQLIKEALRQHQQGRLDRAEQGYRKILSDFPDNADALHYLGVLMHQQGHSQKGARLIRKAINLCPDYLAAHKNLGNVLQESGHLEEAERCYRTAIKLQPGEPDAHTNLSVLLRLKERYQEAIEASLVSVNNNAENPIAWLNFGKALKAGGMIDSAIATFYRALNMDKQMVEAHIELCKTLYRADVPEATVQERISVYREWLKNEPESPVINFMLAACNGDESFSRVPDMVVKKLFDGFATTFDQSLAALDYSVPKLIKNCLAERYPNPVADLTVLDAGCGTGLCAAFLKPLADHLAGVDLSSGMLRQARRHGLYDKLVEGELTTNLQKESEKYDLIICADTLIYFGNLETIFAAVMGALKAGGRFIFSVELLQEGGVNGYQINASGRFSHTSNYVREHIANAGLTLGSIDEVVIRKESGVPVAGLIVDALAAG